MREKETVEREEEEEDEEEDEGEERRRVSGESEKRWRNKRVEAAMS